ncbi:DUF1798 family protein [Staphylococcus felis]|uniref:DUF1798 family protein n=1 Tax=Staphylococcus felis TaxID=46127 RepID=UPI000CCFD913|nr:DUF1798 family protein [Staphylococcus felis]AVP37060.1 DUF1798 domain-containing protein [Staphylococcus felis]PNZ35651.1 DUF1798 domain-containing protein [Staphylococcus felis]QQB02988.1 DUF1798 family protein [Staphylococcus felis]REI09461.1 DUF1798 family protein [Staphylococcus felis]
MILQQMVSNLNQDLLLIKERYTLARNGYQFDFDNEIKPFVQRVDHHMSEFKRYEHEVLGIQYFNQKHFNNLIQLIEDLSITCHYPKTSLKIFMNQYKTVQHHIQMLR